MQVNTLRPLSEQDPELIWQAEHIWYLHQQQKNELEWDSWGQMCTVKVRPLQVLLFSTDQLRSINTEVSDQKKSHSEVWSSACKLQELIRLTGLRHRQPLKSSTLFKLGRYSTMTLKSMGCNSQLFSKSISSALICSQSWLLCFLPTTREIPRERDLRPRRSTTQPRTSEGGRETLCMLTSQTSGLI